MSLGSMRDHAKPGTPEPADEMALLIYRATGKFPREEIWGLTFQMRRAAISVPSSIVKGCARESHAEYLRFFEIVFGSLRELHYPFDLSKRLGYFNEYDISGCESKIVETEKVFGALLRSTREN